MVIREGKAWQGRLVNWVEKSSIEKIHQLLEIFEQECHYKILLTPENISVVRHHPAPYTLPVIPRPLPTDVVEGEHFVIADLRHLVSSSACSSRDPVVEASSRVQGARSPSRPSTSSSGGSSSSHPSPSQRTRNSHPERLPSPVQVAESAPRVVKINRKGASGRRNALGSKGEDFVPWVRADTEDPQDLEEEERDERMAGLLDRYVTHKRKRQVSSGGESDTAPAQTMGLSQPAADGQPTADGGSEGQAIIISASPIIGAYRPNRVGEGRPIRVERG